MAVVTNDGENWREIADQKEKEWKDITVSRIKSLEGTVLEKSKLLAEEQSKFLKLKEDFKYNLKLLQERDQELDRYDKIFKDIKVKENAREVELSELKIQIDDLKLMLQSEEKAKEQLQHHYQQRIGEKDAELQTFRSIKEKELQGKQKEFESFKRKLQMQLTQTREDLNAQGRELTSEFEEVIKRREHEFRVQADEMSAKVLEYELKAKLLAKELDIIKTAQEKNDVEFQQVEIGHRELEKKLKEKDWEIEDAKSMNNARIMELQQNIQQMEKTNKRLQEDFQRKFAEMDRCVREKEETVTKVKNAYKEREGALQAAVRELQSKLEDSSVENRRLQWSRQDIEKEKNLQIEKLHEQLYELKEKWDKQLATESHGQVTKNLEMQALYEMEEKLKSDLLQKKQDIDRYKKELSLSAEREASLEKSKTQMGLDWQRRYEELERQQYEKSEELIRKLTRSRDDAIAMMKEKERELQQKEALIRTLLKDRDQAVSTLKKHGIVLDKNIHVPSEHAFSNAEEIETIKEQNENLKSVIRHMRSQMEDLGEDVPQHQQSDKHVKKSSLTEEYVQTLEKEVRDLKQKARELEQDLKMPVKLHPFPQSQNVPKDEVMLEIKDNAVVRCHIQSLNDTIGTLRAEKMELSAHAKKQQARIEYLEGTQQQLVKEPRQKQVEVDQLQYELASQTRRSQAEIASLRQRIADLEVQLLESRREADEYYKGGLERNMEVTALGQEVSNLKIDLSQRRPPVNFGAQELVIQQFQNEILRLRQNSDGLQEGMSGLGHVPRGRGVTTNATIQDLQSKLHTAAKHIAQLAKERQQLIEMGNKLRAELKLAGVKPPVRPLEKKPSKPDHFTDTMMSSQSLFQQFPDKLNHLEKLQYQLSRQQLEYAQKFPNQSTNAMTVSSSSEDQESRPSILKKSSQSANNTEPGYHPGSDMLPATHRTSASLTASGEQIVDPVSARSRELLLSLSSAGGESLQEIWKMLDEGTSPVTPRYPLARMLSQSPTPVKSSEPEHQHKTKPERRPSSKANLKIKVQKPKIRNYNVKEDNKFR